MRVLLVVTPAPSWTSPRHHEPFEQLVLPRGRFLVSQHSLLALPVDSLELCADRVRVVEIVLGLLPNLLGHRDRTA